MWLKDFFDEQDNPLSYPPFVAISHLCYSDTVADWEYPWHSHRSEFEITFIMKGSGFFIVDDTTTPIKVGDICITPPKVYHRYSMGDEGKMEYFAMRFAAEPAEGELQKYFSSIGPALTPAGKCFAYFRAACDLLLDLHIINNSAQVQTICLPVLQLAATLFANRALTIQTKDNYSAADIMRYITEHCGEKISLQSLGEKFSISPSHLSRMFSNAFHCSPINYLINARMARATEYLGKTDKSVAEIAELVGYENHFYFISLFTKRIGCSPTEYRERLASRDLPKQSTDIFAQGPQAADL